MRISKKEFELGGMGHTHTITLTTDQCQPHTTHGLLLRRDLLQAISESNELSAPGGKPFEKLSVRHDGSAWVATMESVIEAGG